MKGFGPRLVRFLLACTAIATAFLAPGCLFKNPSYPQSWPQVTINEDIEESIQGVYLCVGETMIPNVFGSPVGKSKILSEYFLGPKDRASCDHVDIRRVGVDEIEVRFLQTGSEVSRHSYKRDKDYHVEDGWIALAPRKTLAAEDIVLAYGSDTSYFSVNAEQDLVVREKSTAAGTILVVIPVGGSATQWARFKRKE